MLTHDGSDSDDVKLLKVLEQVYPQREHGERDNIVPDTGVRFKQSEYHEEREDDERRGVWELQGEWQRVEEQI